MKVGKIPETVLKRSVLKQIRHRREEVLVRPGVGEDCSMVQIGEDEIVVLSTDPITGTVDEIGTYAVHVTANDIASSGADAIGILLTILLPYRAGEQELKALIRDIERECEAMNLEILGGHTEVTKAVNQPVITVTGVGKIKKDKMLPTKGAKPGQEIVVTKWVGLEGTAIIASSKEEELKKRYTSEFIERAKGYSRYLSIVPEAKIAREHNIACMHDVTEGGIFGALWEMAAASNVGFEVDLTKIPLKQETVEISEYFDLNPYLLISSGSLVIVSDEANRLVESLEKEGIKATVVGRITKGKERLVINETEHRYLAPPSSDELYKVI